MPSGHGNAANYAGNDLKHEMKAMELIYDAYGEGIRQPVETKLVRPPGLTGKDPVSVETTMAAGVERWMISHLDPDRNCL